MPRSRPRSNKGKQKKQGRQGIISLPWAALSFGLLLILVIAGIALRAGAPLAESWPYYHVRYAEALAEGQINIHAQDPLLVAPREHRYLPLHYVLANTVRWLPEATRLLPVLLVFAAFGLLIIVLRRILPTHHRSGMLLALALSPALLASAVLLGTEALDLFLLALALWLFTFNDRHWLRFLALLPFTALAFNSPSGAALAIASSLIIVLTQKQSSSHVLIGLLPGLFGLGWHVPILWMELGVQPPRYFAELGAWYGTSIFYLVLAGIGLAKIPRLRVVLWTTLALLIAGALSPHFLFAASLTIAALAGLGLTVLATRRWAFIELKPLALLTVLCGLLFINLSSSFQLAQARPSDELLDGLEWLSTQQTDVVLVPPEKGFWVQTQANATVLLDPGPAHQSKETRELLNTLWTETRLDQLAADLRKNQISHIVITPDMSRGLVWDRPEKGLAFLLRNNETFKNVWSNEAITIWKVQQPLQQPVQQLKQPEPPEQPETGAQQ